MKKVLLFIVMAVSASIAQAQIKYGAKGGANLSNVSGKDIEGNRAKIGFNAGVFAEVPVTSDISVHPELVYSAQGAKYKEAGAPYSKVNLGYVNIPLLAKYSDPSGFFGETGPQAGFLISAKATGNGHKMDVKDQFKKLDFSWAFGVGYLSQFNIGVDLRFNLGLSSLDKDNEFKGYNRVIQVGVFYIPGGRIF